MLTICTNEYSMYVCMYVYFNKWRSDRVLVCMNVCMYVCMIINVNVIMLKSMLVWKYVYMHINVCMHVWSPSVSVHVSLLL